jgi:tRNA A-37 threonylcarbamoyl transferase component Bud32
MSEKKSTLKLATFKHTQFLEMGKDLFDLRVGEYLDKIGEENIISLHPISYQHIDMTTREVIVDYGVVVFYREVK